MDIEQTTVVDVPDQHRYEIRSGDQRLGLATYELRDGAVVFLHTETEPAVQGQGVGGRLAQGALDDVRRRGLSAVPRCSFIAGWIDDHPEYADLVAHD
jgi:hypothetical protein